MIQTHPSDAIKVTFSPLLGTNHFYWVWQSSSKWFWYALGNSGYERTQEEAMRSARNWITQDVRGRDVYKNLAEVN